MTDSSESLLIAGIISFSLVIAMSLSPLIVFASIWISAKLLNFKNKSWRSVILCSIISLIMVPTSAVIVTMIAGDKMYSGVLAIAMFLAGTGFSIKRIFQESTEQALKATALFVLFDIILLLIPLGITLLLYLML